MSKFYNNIELVSTPIDEDHVAKIKNIKINKIKVNGTEQTITDKSVDIFVPTKTSELINDSGFSKDGKDITFS